jgi:hypothetical protein
MPEYLVGIMFHEPGPFAQWNRGLIEDYESSIGLFVTADTAELAVAWGEQVGEALLRYINRDGSLDWRRFGYFCWVEENQATDSWAHCLEFFQHVREGEMPDLGRMGTAAYSRWQQQRHAKGGPASDCGGE